MSLLGYKVFVIPPSTLAVTASHPCKNLVSLHLVLRRMHQKLDYHIHRHRLCAYPSIEIYDGSSVRVMAPLTRQTQYFVPEVILPPKWSWCLNYIKKDGALAEDEDDDYEEEEEDEEED
ncbi:testis-expressed protein 264 [Anabrus simplex]|uniref:testis-expressed protein 264 n=1 Tax=Anabrus simplex TaxID=316456 RepID=UPI0034DD8B55